jgi:NAD-dependent DNA ligase
MSELLKQILNAEDYDEFSSADIVSVLVAADDAYENGDEPLMADATYDTLKQHLISTDPKNDYLQHVGSDVRGGKVALPNNMGSLTQVYEESEFALWRDKHGIPSSATILGSIKLDGMSGSGYYGSTGALRIAYSRGNGFEGADITRHVKHIKSMPKNAPPNTEVRFEIIISKPNFELVKKLVFRRDGSEYKNPRNMISGLMNSSDIPMIAYNYIDCVVYHDWNEDDHMADKDIQLLKLKTDGFLIPTYVTFPASQLTDEYLTKLVTDMKTNSKYELDGVVLEVNSAELRKKMNPSKATLNPEYARKYKVADAANMAIAVVSYVELRVSKRGYVKPRIHYQPFSLPGITVTHTTGYNMKFIMDHGISPGAVVKVQRCGDVIPNVVGFVSKGSYTPECYIDELNEIGEWKWTVNDKGEEVDVMLLGDHSDIILKLTEAFFTGIGVDGLKLGNLRKMFSVGLDTPAKIIKADADLIGFAIASQTTADKIHTSIRKALHNVTQPQFMGATGLFGRGIGQRKIQKLFDVFGEDIIDLDAIHKFAGVEGFDVKSANKFINGLPAYLEFYTDVCEYVEFVVPKVIEGGRLNGQQFLFTGFRNKDLKAKLEAEGGVVLDTFTSKVTAVIAADPEDRSGKIEKARKAGVKIIGLADVDTELLGK